MSNTFNFNRFGKYFVYDLKRQWKNIGLLMLIFTLFPIIFYMIYMFFAALFDGGLLRIFSGIEIDGPAGWTRFGVFAIMTVIFVMIYPSRAYGEITDKAKGSEWLMLPASRLEKFASMMIISLVIIPIIYISVYFLCDAFVCLLDNSCGDSLMSFRINKEIETSDFIVPANGFWILAANIVEYVSIFLLGGLIFKKWKVVGTALAIFVLGMVFSGLLSAFITNADLEWWGIWINDWTIRHADNIDFWLNAFLNFWLLLIVAVCGTWSWFRIKRMQH
ncbi:MAG TPA: hypothetical protein DIT75_02300 [Rikenellaceae bacterium]|nr:hypothetical protein [Rikenellaceae bacterium]